MPPSKEMEKTRKVNKGPSALDIVKKKYKGQIMDVKKEELDLTKVAEAFGGYIVEKKGEKIGKVKPGEKEAEIAAIRKAAEEPKLSPSGQKRLTKISKSTKITDKNLSVQLFLRTREQLRKNAKTIFKKIPKKVNHRYIINDFIIRFFFNTIFFNFTFAIYFFI